MTKINYWIPILFSLTAFIPANLFAEKLILSPTELAHQLNFIEKQFPKSKKVTQLTSIQFSQLALMNGIDKRLLQGWLTQQNLNQINPKFITERQRIWLQHLKEQPNTIKTWMLDAGHRIRINAFDNPQRANALLKQYGIISASKSSVKFFQKNQWQAITHEARKVQQQGNLLALKKVSEDKLFGFYSYLIQQPLSRDYQFQLLLKTSLRLKQYEGLNKVIGSANSQIANRIMQHHFYLDTFSYMEQKSILLNAVHNPKLASAAVLQLSKYVSNDKQISNYLLSLLSSRNLGGSAMSALKHHVQGSLKSSLVALSKSTNLLEKKRSQLLLQKVEGVQ